MRLIAIGDIHGRSSWKQIIEKEKFDRVVFMGDYFDSAEGISPEKQKENFREILAYKKENPDSTTLLFGNHDFHYLDAANETYSGYQKYQKIDIQELLLPAINSDLLTMCFSWYNLLFSHAGVTQTWCADNGIETSTKSIATQINDLFKFKPVSFKFRSGKNRDPYGDDVEQSPIWVRPNSLVKDKIKHVTQIVGHTEQSNIVAISGTVFIDTLGTSGEYLILDDFKFSVGKTC